MRFLRLVAVSILLAMAVLSAWAQIGIGGITTKTIYVDQATFTVTNEAGFVYDARLDGNPVPVGTVVLVKSVDYHELSVFRTNTSTLAVTNRLVQFIVRSSERGSSEDGLPPWTPYPPIPSANGEFAGATLSILAPADLPQGLPIPIVAWVENGGHAVRANGTITAPGQTSFELVRGVGSGFLSGTNAAGTLNYQPAVGGLTATRTINVETGTVWTSVGGTLSGAINWPSGSRIAVTNHLVLSSGATLTIGAGTVVRLNAGVDITNNASVVINGTWEQPVVFTPAAPSQPWGGFTMRTSEGSITGGGVIFTGSGAVANWFGSGSNPSSHRKEQGLFFCGGDNVIALTNAAAISLAGQLGHSVSGGRFTLRRFLMQRTTSGGEFTGSAWRVNNSAFIECPDASANFVDGDNDALYIVSGTHGFTNTLFGFTKDDGVDSGASSAGTLNYQDCWFESTFHEGNSLSGTGKIANHNRTVFINCGQGLEVGYDGPTGNLFDCLATGNLVGGRFGDNYNWTYSGFLRTTNSLLIYNYRDVWGMNWADWSYRTAQMDIRSNLLAAADPIWPANVIWNPATDAPQLADFINGPAGCPVGIGFALRTNRADATALTNGVPVRLSRFSTNPVTVHYVAQSASGTLASGTLTFGPGETLKTLMLPIASPQNHELVSLRLSDPVNAELTGIPQIFTVTPPAAASPVTLIAQGSVWRHLDSGVNLSNAWVAPDFPDVGWPSGAAQLGFGDGDEVSLVASNGQVTTYFRRSFNVADPAGFQSLTLALLRDDGGIVYLNGTEVFRSNLPQTPVTYTTLATNALTQDETAFFYTNTVTESVLVVGTNVCSVEIHQSSTTSSDLSFDLKLYGNPAVPVLLKHGVFDGQLVLYWDDASFLLEEAPQTAGPWMPVMPGTNPQAVAITGTQQFFRLCK
jgi:hypothetical protein